MADQQQTQRANAQSPSDRQHIPRVLSIAGSDPSGGAGIQADLKSIAANGGYAMAVVTALTAQNTRGVRSVHVPPVGFLREQLDAISDDITVDAVKIGMLGDAQVISTVGRWLERNRPAVVVLDPVMVASSGDRLLAPDAEAGLRDLLRHADLVTPNLPELAVLLTDDVARTWDEALAQGKKLAGRDGIRVLVKGGHLVSADCPDALVEPDGTITEFSSPRVPTANTHGTGCSLSSGLATVQAQLGDWPAALERVKDWLHNALLHADELQVGTGHGPVHHFHAMWTLQRPLGLDPSAHSSSAHLSLAQAQHLHAQPLSAQPASALPPSAQPLSAQPLSAQPASALPPFAQPASAQPPSAQPASAQPPSAQPLSEPASALPLSAKLWEETAELRAAIFALPFIRTLADGTLPADQFAYYLAQDALYLNGYSRVLARASALAPTEAEQLFWANSAQVCLAVETELHRSWLGADRAQPPLGRVTKGYLDHLLAASARGSYAELVAAVLPCYWLYAEVGATLHAGFTADYDGGTHPYAAWLETYADEEFAAATRRAIGFMDTAALVASEAERERMREAYLYSSSFELDFFDAPRLYA
jgi:hydroxymethylpyrimidine kinase/phosphomethylpyrimidine kinase